MGLFGSKRKVYISSQVYNLAGKFEDRPNFKKEALKGAIIRLTQNPRHNFSEEIRKIIKTSPMSRQENYMRWANNSDYWNKVKQNRPHIILTKRDDYVYTENVLSQIGKGSNEIYLQNIGGYGVKESVVKYLLERPYITGNYSLDSDTHRTVNVPSQEVIEYVLNGYRTTLYEEGSIVKFSYNHPGPYNNGLLTININIPLIKRNDPNELTLIYRGFTSSGGTLKKETSKTYPITTGYDLQVETLFESISFDTEKKINTKVTDSKGNLITEFVTYDKRKDAYTPFFRSYYLMDKSLPLPERIDVKSIGTVTKVSKNVTYEKDGEFYEETIEENVYVNKYEVTYFPSLVNGTKSYGPFKMETFRKGQYPLMDPLFDRTYQDTSYAPFMPIRLNKLNQISNDYGKLNDKGYEVLTGNIYKDLINSVNSSSGIGDVQNAYIVQGVSLTTQDNLCKEYIWTFFKEVHKAINPNNVLWGPIVRADKLRTDNLWEYHRKRIVGGNYIIGQPGFPPQGEFSTYIDLKVTDPPFNYQASFGSFHNIGTVSNFGFGAIDLVRKNGIYKNLKPGEYKLERLDMTLVTSVYYGQTVFFPESRLETVCKPSIFPEDPPTCYLEWVHVGWRETTSTAQGTTRTGGGFQIYRQYDGYYEYFEVWDSYYETRVFEDRWAGAYGGDMINYAPDESVAIIPLNLEILRRMPALSAGHAASNTLYVMFNAWKVVTTKWYQSGFFSVLLIVAAIVISVYFTPATGAGLLGTNVAVGTAMGFTGIAALVAGAVANTIVGILLTYVIDKVVDLVVGSGTLGTIVKMIATWAVGQFGKNGTFIDSIKEAFNELLSVENILKATQATANIYQQKLVGDFSQFQNQFIQDLDSMSAQSKAIDSKMKELGFTGELNLDPSFITNIKTNPNEYPEDFLARTLLSGSDIIEQSFRMISDYVEIQNSLHKENFV